MVFWLAQERQNLIFTNHLDIVQNSSPTKQECGSKMSMLFQEVSHIGKMKTHDSKVFIMILSWGLDTGIFIFAGDDGVPNQRDPEVREKAELIKYAFIKNH